MTLFRREFLQMIAGAAIAPAVAFRPAAAEATLRHVRVATGLLATWQSTAWLGAAAGVFKTRGIDMSLPASANKKHNSATIVVDDRQFCYRINPDGVFGTHRRRPAAAKTAEQLDLQALHRVRERLVRQRTAIINQIRAFLLDRGIAVRQGQRFLRDELPRILAMPPMSFSVQSATAGVESRVVVTIFTLLQATLAQ